jgi:hypothetical protein
MQQYGVSIHARLHSNTVKPPLGRTIPGAPIKFRTMERPLCSEQPLKPPLGSEDSWNCH